MFRNFRLSKMPKTDFIFTTAMLTTLVMIAIVSTNQSIADEQEWIGTGSSGGNAFIAYGRFDNDADNLSAGLSLPTFKFSELQFYYSQFDYQDSGYDLGSSNWSIGWNSDPVSKPSFNIAYSVSGIDSQVETHDLNVQVNFDLIKQWGVGLKLIYGSVDLHADDITQLFEDEFEKLELLQRDRNGIGASLRYSEIDWEFNFAFNYHHYESLALPTTETILIASGVTQQELEQSSRLLIAGAYLKRIEQYQERGFTRQEARQLTNTLFRENRDAILRWAERQLDQRILRYQSSFSYYYRSIYNQQALLSNYDFRLDASFIVGNFSYNIGALSYEAHLEENIYSQLFAGLEYSFTSGVNVGTNINYSVDEPVFYGELSLGYSW